MHRGPVRPNNVNPSIETTHVVMATKNWSSVPGVCSVGLSVTAGNTMRVLRRHGVHTESWQVKDVPELYRRIASAHHSPGPTHIITSAPSFLQPFHFVELSGLYPDTEFIQQNHTGTAYFYIDKFGIKNIRSVLDLEKDLHNVRVSWNNPRGRDWSVNTFHGGDLLLPNLYDTTTFVNPVSARPDPDPIRIGSFGANRLWKNFLSAAQAAILIAERLGVGLEYYVSSGRPEAAWSGERMMETRAELFEGMFNKKIINVPWCPWPQFRRVVRTMDLLIQPSFDETFCVVVADGIAEGVPSVCGEAMEWAPASWHCKAHDPMHIMQTGMGLLHDLNSVHEGRSALQRYVDQGVHLWLNYLLKK